jgi:adenylate kinase family enzyme
VYVSPAEAKRRLLLRARHDDGAAEIDRRLSWYKTEVLPAVNYLKNRPGYLFHDINGEQSPAKVHAEIISRLSF